MKSMYSENSLVLNESKCTGCKMCIIVCPHAVFQIRNKKAVIVNYQDCMECGACKMNCKENAIDVNAGVGCAAALIYQAITGKEYASCG